MKKMFLPFIWLLVVLPCHADIITVDDDAIADFNTIQSAIDAAQDGDTVLVRDGIYTGDGNRDINLDRKAIIIRSENGPENCVIDVNAVKWDFHYGFHINACEDMNTVVKGFTIINGYQTRNGGGGGAFQIVDSNCLITDCWLFNNTGVHGGAIRFTRSNAVVTNCFFADNFAWKGSAIYSDNSLKYHPGPRNGGPDILNCLFVDNRTRMQGFLQEGTIAIYNSDTVIMNCTLLDNNFGILVIEGHVKIINSILWNENCEIKTPHWYKPTIDVTYSSIRGFSICQGDNTIINWLDGNIDADPLFVNSAENDFRLLPHSPCVDAGDPNYIAEPKDTDLDGNPRIVNGRIDMGAYEVQPLGPDELLLDLIDYIDELNLHGGTTNSLLAKLEAALEKLEDSNDATAVNLLEAFINAVEAQSGKKISEADADELIAAAEEIIELLI